MGHTAQRTEPISSRFEENATHWSPRICVCTPEKGVFVDAHIANLTNVVAVLHNGYLPYVDEHGTRVVGVFRRFAYAYRQHLPGFLQARLNGMMTDALAKFFRRRKVDVVLAEYGPTGAAVLPACKAASVGLVTHFHGYDAYRFDIVESHNQYKELFAYRRGISIAVSKHMMAQLLGYGCRPENLVYSTSGGPDLTVFKHIDAGQNGPRFVSVGRFVEKKAPHLMILAFHRLLGTVPEAELDMVGDGPLMGACQQLASSLRITDKVHFHGTLDAKGIAGVLAGSRVFIQHSMVARDGDREGTPLAILEAAAVGLPVVATRHCGIQEFVTHGVNGFLVDEGDIDRMAHYMGVLLGDVSLARAMGGAGRELVEAEYSQAHRISHLHSILSRAAKSETPTKAARASSSSK